MSDEKAVSLYRCVQLATVIREPAPVRRIIGHPVIQAAGSYSDAHGTKQGRQNTSRDAEAIYESLRGQAMDVLVKCLAFFGAVSLLGSLLLLFLALRFTKETPTTYHSDLDSTAKPRAGTIITLDFGRPRKGVDLLGRLELSQRRTTFVTRQ